MRCTNQGKGLENGLVRSECFTIGAEFNILVWIGAVSSWWPGGIVTEAGEIGLSVLYLKLVPC